MPRTNESFRRDQPDIQWLERMYNNRMRVPDHPAYFARWAAESALVRRTLACELDVPYGDAPRERVDAFMAPRKGAPLVYGAVPSPDGAHVLMPYDFWPPRLIDLRSGVVITVGGARGLTIGAWMSDSSRYFLLEYGSETLPAWDNAGQSSTALRFPGRMLTTTATSFTSLALSASGVEALDALVLDPIAGVRSSRTTQISISDLRTGFLRTLFERNDARAFDVTWLSNDIAAFLLESPLPDAPSGHFGYRLNHTELWQLNVRNGQTKRIAEVGSRVEYAHQIIRLGTVHVPPPRSSQASYL